MYSKFYSLIIFFLISHADRNADISGNVYIISEIYLKLNLRAVTESYFLFNFW